MRIDLDQDQVIEITEVYNSIKLKTNAGETLYICMRDSGFEFTYAGQDYEAKEGELKKRGIKPTPSNRDIGEVIDFDFDVNFDGVESPWKNHS